MKDWTIRPAEAQDAKTIAALVTAAFAGDAEAKLVAALRADGHAVLELVAERGSGLVGHILFSRLRVEAEGRSDAAVALAPLAVAPAFQGQGIGIALVEAAHAHLRGQGETLVVVLGDPAFYGRFGYSHGRAEKFASGYQCDALQALAWSGEAPERGRLVYAAAFAAL